MSLLIRWIIKASKWWWRVRSTKYEVQSISSFLYSSTAISRKVVGKSARDNPDRYCGWFWIHCSSKKFKRMTRGAMDVCLRVLKESNKGRFDSYTVRNSVLITSHITFRDCRVLIFSANLPRHGCIFGKGFYLKRPILGRISAFQNWLGL